MTATIGRFEEIKAHFEKEAAEFDALFFKVMPEYEAMMQAVVDSLPFPRSAALEIADLGCGTGNLAGKIIEWYPRARVTCVDMAENMLTMARTKLVGKRVSFHQADIRGFPYARETDAIVSSLVLHHIEKKDKPAFYHKLHSTLAPGGVFFNIDMVLSSNEHLQGLYREKWKEFMKQSGLPQEKVREMIRRHQREDRPVALEEELSALRAAGFKDVDVVLKRYNFAVYGGIR